MEITGLHTGHQRGPAGAPAWAEDAVRAEGSVTTLASGDVLPARMFEVVAIPNYLDTPAIDE